MKYLLILFTCLSFGQFNPIFFSSGNTNKTGLVTYYKFDSNSNDFTTNSHNGTDASVVYSNGGKVGNSATVNGSNSFISIPQSSDFDFSNIASDIPFSISFWVNMNTQPGYGEILGKGGVGSIYQWAVRKNSGVNSLEIVLSSDASNYKLWGYTSNVLTSAVWYHVVITYDGLAADSSIKTYLNNSVITPTVTNSGTYTKMPISTQPMFIGKRGDDTLFFNGKLDELAIYRNKVLTVGEINTLYTNGLAGIPIL